MHSNSSAHTATRKRIHACSSMRSGQHRTCQFVSNALDGGDKAALPPVCRPDCLTLITSFFEHPVINITYQQDIPSLESLESFHTPLAANWRPWTRGPGWVWMQWMCGCVALYAQTPLQTAPDSRYYWQKNRQAARHDTQHCASRLLRSNTANLPLRGCSALHSACHHIFVRTGPRQRGRAGHETTAAGLPAATWRRDSQHAQHALPAHHHIAHDPTTRDDKKH